MIVIPRTSGLSRQIIAGTTACLSTMAGATVYAWVSPTLPILLGPDSEIPLSAEDASWIVALPYIGSALSPIPAGLLSDRIGRKAVIMTSAPLILTGWVIILYLKTLLSLYISRIIQGFGIGIIFTVVPIYLGEIAAPKCRGLIVSFFYIFWCLGYIFEYITGSMFPFTEFTVVTALINVIFVVAFIPQPESPYYYLLKNDIYRAEQSLSWFLLSSNEDIRTEIDGMKQFLEKRNENPVTCINMIAEPLNRKGLIILLLIGFITMFCGLTTVSSYSTETLTEEGDYFILSPDNVTIVMGVMMLFGSFVSYFTLDYFGRRISLFFSCLLSGLCMTLVGTFYLIKEHSDLDLSVLSWVPSVGMIIFSAACTIGIFPVGSAYQSELFDTSFTATASSIMNVFNIAIGIFPVLLYIPIANSLGLYVNFYVYALCCFFGAILSYTVMPETKGKTFDEIVATL